jgi:basic membrane lipoprotein Med (substrate-binding protein (PBP1-ABC) superfamily)
VTTKRTTAATPRVTMRVGIVGRIAVDVPGVAVKRGSLADVADSPLVLVDARVSSPTAVADAARAHPLTHFALVGTSARDEHVPNLAGIVLRRDGAAYLAGVTSGLAAATVSGDSARVAWVGPDTNAVAESFGRGVHAAAPTVVVLHQSSGPVPARCKEAALTALSRGALIVTALGGLCADAATTAAHEQNVPALRLGDFLLPDVAAALVARDASHGIFHGGEDVVFGPETGAVGVRRLDARIPVDVAAKVRSAAQELAGGGGSGG